MKRRDFVRLAGGGTVLAAALPMTACSGDYPPEAVAAWAGPGENADLRQWALGHAILAPNSHNRQPWLVDLREPNSITLFVDRERLLPQTDPWFRQIVVSQGTFLETLVLALKARGIEPQVQLFPQGEPAPRSLDERPVARLSWRPEAAKPQTDPLFAQVLRRHTAKVAYDTSRPVTPAVLAQLQQALVDPQVAFGGTVAAGDLPALRTLCLESARVELSTPRTVMESVRLTRVGPDEIRRHRDGISINSPMLRALSSVGLFDRSQPPAPDSSAFKNMLQRYEDHSQTAMGFAWLSTPRAGGRSAEVNAGRAFMRLQLRATELGLQMHPMSQAPQEFAEMKPFYDELHQRLLGPRAQQDVVQMFCRIGYCADQQHTPRRELSALIKS
jgi:nitroreductase